MDADLKAKWVASLRSGEYKQGKYVLKTNDGKFCCLGVLCDLIDKDGWGDDVQLSKDGDKGFPYNGEVQMITIEMQNKIGFKNPMTFSDLNDHGTSFEKIADIIETEGVYGEEI